VEVVAAHRTVAVDRAVAVGTSAHHTVVAVRAT
jgi:hypothetical protein